MQWYVVGIIQKQAIGYLPNAQMKRWAITLEEARHWDRLSDAVRAKNKFLNQPSMIRLNSLPVAPPAGYIDAEVIEIDLKATFVTIVP